MAIMRRSNWERPPDTFSQPNRAVAIEIVVQLFIDFEKVRRHEKGAPDLTAEEEQSRKQKWTKNFADMYEVVRKGGDMARVTGQLLSFFE